MSDIKGKVIAITGASSGIGEATARLLGQKGAKLVLGARGAERLAAVAGDIAAGSSDVVQCVVDVRNRADVQALTNLALERFGRLDVLISNAGVAPNAPLDDIAVEDWDAMIDVNLRGFLHGVAAALPIFRRQRSGHFVTTISTAGLRIVPNQVVYAGTKNAVRTIMEGLRQESRGDFRVTGVSPGFVKTNLVDSMRNQEVVGKIRERMAEIGIEPAAVARAVSFAIEQPEDVDVGDIVVRPTVQD